MTPILRILLRLLLAVVLLPPCSGQSFAGRHTVSAVAREAAPAESAEVLAKLTLKGTTLQEAADRIEEHHRDLLDPLKEFTTVAGFEFSISLPVRPVNSIRWIADNMTSTTTFGVDAEDGSGEPSASVSYRLRIPQGGGSGGAEAAAARSSVLSRLRALGLETGGQEDADPLAGPRVLAADSAMAQARRKAREESYRKLSAAVALADSSLDRWPEIWIVQTETGVSVQAACTASSGAASGSAPVIGASATLAVEIPASRVLLAGDVVASGADPAEAAENLGRTLDAIEQALAGEGKPAVPGFDVSIMGSEGELQDGVLVFDSRKEQPLQYYWHRSFAVDLSGGRDAAPESILREAVRLVGSLEECGARFYGGRPPLSTIAERGFGVRIGSSRRAGIIRRRPCPEDAEAAESAAAGRAYARVFEAAGHIAELSGRKLGALQGIELRSESGEDGETVTVTVSATWESLPG